VRLGADRSDRRNTNAASTFRRPPFGGVKKYRSGNPPIHPRVRAITGRGESAGAKAVR